jgi:hypothetical protein
MNAVNLQLVKTIMQRGVVTAAALNGSGASHDTEIALGARPRRMSSQV